MSVTEVQYVSSILQFSDADFRVDEDWKSELCKMSDTDEEPADGALYNDMALWGRQVNRQGVRAAEVKVQILSRLLWLLWEFEKPLANAC